MTEPVDPGELAWAALAAQPVRAPVTEVPGNLGYTPDQPYTAQPYPAQPYPAQPYPAQPYPGQPYPGQPYQPHPVPGIAGTRPAPLRRRRVIAGVVVLVLTAAALGTALVVGSHSNSPSGPTSFPLPSTLGGYPLQPGGTADAFRNNVAQAYGTTGELGRFFATATIGLYGPGDQSPKLIVLVGRAGAFPGVNAGSFATGGPGQFTSFPAGPHGGLVECFGQSVGTANETFCFWSDPKAVGYVIGIGSEPEVAALVNTARDTIEH